MLACADARPIPLADETVQCVVTSPPYWGLRKYAGEQDLIWGGDANCAHEFDMHEVAKENFQSCAYGRGHAYTTIETSEWREGFCHCGAWRGAYGLEPSVELYVENTVEILREIRRVLRKDGVVFWNVGDSYFNCTYTRESARGCFRQCARVLRRTGRRSCERETPINGENFGRSKNERPLPDS